MQQQPALSSFSDAFPEHAVSLMPRPDGSLLIKLEKEENLMFSRAIDAKDLFCPMRTNKVIHQIQRDMNLDEGNVALDQQWMTTDLPTYLGQPIHLRAIQTLVAKRRIK